MPRYRFFGIPAFSESNEIKSLILYVSRRFGGLGTMPIELDRLNKK